MQERQGKATRRREIYHCCIRRFLFFSIGLCLRFSIRQSVCPAYWCYTFSRAASGYSFLLQASELVGHQGARGRQNKMEIYGQLTIIRLLLSAYNMLQIAPYSLEELSEPQRENEEELLSDLNENMCRLIARNRFKNEDPAMALQKVKDLCKTGPYDDAQEAIRTGLIDGVTYKRFVLEQALDASRQSEDTKVLVADSAPAAVKSLISDVEQELAEIKNRERLHGFYHYSQTMEEMMDKSDADVMEIGCVYLMGTIGEQGTEFGHESVIRGLREAANDKEIKAVVLRVDSGGGGVIASDSIWDAVRELKSKGKVVIGSFANAAASGGYLAACHVDAILAQPSTITGSIGVARSASPCYAENRC